MEEKWEKDFWALDVRAHNAVGRIVGRDEYDDFFWKKSGPEAAEMVARHGRGALAGQKGIGEKTIAQVERWMAMYGHGYRKFYISPDPRACQQYGSMN